MILAELCLEYAFECMHECPPFCILLLLYYYYYVEQPYRINNTFAFSVVSLFLPELRSFVPFSKTFLTICENVVKRDIPENVVMHQIWINIVHKGIEMWSKSIKVHYVFIN